MNIKDEETGREARIPLLDKRVFLQLEGEHGKILEPLYPEGNPQMNTALIPYQRLTDIGKGPYTARLRFA